MAIDTETASKYALAKAWLLAELADGTPHVAGGVLMRAEEAGHNAQTIKRAARALRVREFDACVDARRKSGFVWLWQLKVS
jgi:hypothetical protein